MTDDAVASLSPPTPLAPTARRVLGVLVEKAFTTPEGYPLTLNALVVGCNQKSNRDPVTHHDDDACEVELEEMMAGGLVVRVLPATGRTERYKHAIKERWGLERPARAVLAELFLRGPQTEGELRGRASRMVEIATLEELRAILEQLAARGFVARMSEEGRKRGVVWTHRLYEPGEQAAIERDHASAADDDETPRAVATARARNPEISERLARLEADVARLASLVDDLASEVARLKGS